MGEGTTSTSLGGMAGYLLGPGGGGPCPGVVLRDGFGIGQAVRVQADWLAGAGYLAMSAGGHPQIP